MEVTQFLILRERVCFRWTFIKWSIYEQDIAVETQQLKHEGSVMKSCYLICLSLVLSIFMGCVSIFPRHPEFTSKNIIDIKVGMTQKEIEAIFGSPDRTSTITMGTKTPDPWPSLIYYYDMKKNRLGKDNLLVYTNTFYFVLDIQPPLLRSWELELIYPERK